MRTKKKTVNRMRQPFPFSVSLYFGEQTRCKKKKVHHATVQEKKNDEPSRRYLNKRTKKKEQKG